MSKNRKQRQLSNFLTNDEVQALGLSPRETRRADGTHSEMLAQLAERGSHTYRGRHGGKKK